jgi:hypothetical protein
MNNKIIPYAVARAQNVIRWQEVCLMLDNLNLELEQGMTQADYDLQNSPLYIHRRERVRKQLESNKQS